MSEQSANNPGEEVWLYVSDPELLERFLSVPKGIRPAMANKFRDTILAARSPHRSRISAEQELWYALIRVGMELGPTKVNQLLESYINDINQPEVQRALANPDDSIDSV